MESPHDTLFQAVFRHPAHAAGWLRCVLPAILVAAIDWDTLEQVHPRAIGPRLRSHIADVVFVATLIGTGTRVLLIVEHKFGRDPLLRSQMLRYAVHLRRVERRRHGAEPLVLAVVLHHSDALVDCAVDEQDSALAPLAPATRSAFATLQPQLELLVDDVTSRSEGELRLPVLSPFVQLCLLSMRSLPGASTEAALAAIDRWADLLRAVAADPGPPHPDDAIHTFLCYVLDVTEVPEDRLDMAIARILDQNPGHAMTRTQRMRQEGQAVGEAIGQANTLLRQLTRRFGQLPAELVQRVRTAPASDLDRWVDRILDAKSLEEVFAA